MTTESARLPARPTVDQALYNEVDLRNARRVAFRRGAVIGGAVLALALTVGHYAYDAIQPLTPGCSFQVDSGDTLNIIGADIAGGAGQSAQNVEADIADTPGPHNGGGTLMPGQRINLPAGAICQAAVQYAPGRVGLPVNP